LPSHRRNRSEKDRDNAKADKAADNWKAVRRMGKAYAIAGALALSAMLYGAGYSMGVLDQGLACLRKESNR
jgi:hypothetical protein